MLDELLAEKGALCSINDPTQMNFRPGHSFDAKPMTRSMSRGMSNMSGVPQPL
jgi:hypothetical protein